MPCYDPRGDHDYTPGRLGDDNHDWARMSELRGCLTKTEDRLTKTEDRLAKTEAMLCAMVDLYRSLVSALNTIGGHIDWNTYGVTPKEIADWHTAHKDKDRQKKETR